MKKVLLIISSVLLLLMAYACQPSDATEFTFRNIASNAVYVNFRAELITVQAGETVVLKDVPRGTFAYETTYQIPEGATSSTTVGPVSGTVEFQAGTKALIIYSSTFIEGTYTIGATLTTNNDDEGDPVSP